MDRLVEAIRRTGNPSVVGLDPTPELVPRRILNSHLGPHPDSVRGKDRILGIAHAYWNFNTAIIEAIAGIVPAVKLQIAMYEALGEAGIAFYQMTADTARRHGLYVIGDIKRGDIGSTAAAYAAHLAGLPDVEDVDGSPGTDLWHEDAVTVNPYLGWDGVKPFVDAATECDKDIFTLVRTSNPSSAEIQELPLAGGGTVADHVAGLVEKWGADTIGVHGYSRVGAVVGATHPEAGAHLREVMPHSFLLVPGYGAQGGTAADATAMFDAQGGGAIVNSSRGIIGAWRGDPDYSPELSLMETCDVVKRSARRAAEAMRDDLRNALRDAGKDSFFSDSGKSDAR